MCSETVWSRIECSLKVVDSRLVDLDVGVSLDVWITAGIGKLETRNSELLMLITQDLAD